MKYSNAAWHLLWSSALQIICSFMCVSLWSGYGSCFIQKATVKLSVRLWLRVVSGITTAFDVPSNSYIWSLSWPSSVGRPRVHSAPIPGLGNRSMLSELAPILRMEKKKKKEQLNK